MSGEKGGLGMPAFDMDAIARSSASGRAWSCVGVWLKPDPHAPSYRPARSRRRRETVSSVTAARRIAPVTMYLIDEL